MDGKNIVGMADIKSEMYKRIYFIKTDGILEIGFAEDRDNCTSAKVSTMLINKPLQAHFHAGGEVFINNIHGINEAIGLTEVLLDKGLWDGLVSVLSKIPDFTIRQGLYEIHCQGYCWLFVDFDSREDLIGFISGKKLYWFEQLEAMRENMIARPKKGK